MNPIVPLVIVLFVVLYLMSRPRTQAHQRRQMAADADQLLTRAESRLLLGQYNEAAAMYRTAYELGQRAGATLLCAEASSGLARIALAQGDTQTAIRYLEQALSAKDTWASDKPAFARLLETQLASARKRVE